MDVVIVDHQVPDKLRKIYQLWDQFQCQKIAKKNRCFRTPAKVFHPAPPLSDQVGFVSSHWYRRDSRSHLSWRHSRPGGDTVRWWTETSSIRLARKPYFVVAPRWNPWSVSRKGGYSWPDCVTIMMRMGMTIWMPILMTMSSELNMVMIIIMSFHQ